jgi:hypothetical protein
MADLVGRRSVNIAVIPFVAPAGQALTGVQGNCGNFFDRMFFLQ